MTSKKSQIVYKVVTVDGFGRLWSAISYLHSLPQLSLEYFVKQWVEPKVGKIFTFERLGDAFDFAGERQRVYKAEAQDIISTPPRIADPWAIYSNTDCRALWEDINTQKFLDEPFINKTERFVTNRTMTAPVPVGTVLCGSIKLLEIERR